MMMIRGGGFVDNFSFSFSFLFDFWRKNPYPSAKEETIGPGFES